MVCLLFVKQAFENCKYREYVRLNIHIIYDYVRILLSNYKFASRVNTPTLLSHLSVALNCLSFLFIILRRNPRRLILVLLRIVTGVPLIIFWWFDGDWLGAGFWGMGPSWSGIKIVTLRSSHHPPYTLIAVVLRDLYSMYPMVIGQNGTNHGFRVHLGSF